MDAVKAAGHEAPDPGLRDNFHSLPRAPISLVCCALAKQVNQGGIIRLAEAFRLESVKFEVEPEDVMDMAGARGAGQWLDWQYQNPSEAISQAKSQGRQVVALTLNQDSVSIHQVPWQFPCTLVLGEEKAGVPKEIEEACDLSAAIPLYGMMQSLNVTHAAVIAVWEALNAYRSIDPDFMPARSVSKRLLNIDGQ